MTQKSHRGTEGQHQKVLSVFLWTFCGSVVSRKERGAVLGMVIMIAVITAIGAYTLLWMAASQARQARAAGVNVQHTQARYAAEGGLVYAQQRLFAEPTYCGGSTVVGGLTVNVSVSLPCVDGVNHTINATVDY